MKMRWRYLQALGTRFAQRVGKPHRFGSTIRDNATQHGKRAANRLDYNSHRFPQFVGRHAGTFSHAAANHHAGNPCFLQIERFPRQTGRVDPIIVGKWSKHRRYYAREDTQLVRDSPPAKCCPN